MSKRPSTPRQLRVAFILVGFAFFVWLPFEDQNLRWVLLLASLASILIVVYLAIRVFPARLGNHYFPILGVIAGLLIPPLAVLLMALKTGLHGHLVPDFTRSQVISVLQRMPVWMVAGFLVGLGLAIWRSFQGKFS